MVIKYHLHEKLHKPDQYINKLPNITNYVHKHIYHIL